MDDITYTFIEDVKNKKRIARGSYNKMAHAGRGGAMKTPSDYLTSKERKKMNGETISYRLNEPMGYKEFRAMPTEIQKIYIQNLIDKFDIEYEMLGNMFGVSKTCAANTIKVLGLATKHRGGSPCRNKDAFYHWVNGTDGLERPVEEVVEDKKPEIPTVVPECGEMRFVGSIEDIAEKLKFLLRGGDVIINVSWHTSNSTALKAVNE